MMQFTTSKRISLMFTVYTMCIVFFFGIIINIVFFQQRYQTENVKLQSNQRMGSMVNNRRAPRFAPSPVQTIVFTPTLAQELQENRIFRGLSSIDDEYVMYLRMADEIKISVVSHLVQAQEKLIQLFLLLMIVFAFVTYGFSLLFVKSGLRNIKNLVRYVETLDIHSLDSPVPLAGPSNDEIRKIGETLQEALYTIKEQTDSLKDFVTHASHELKTPLMSLSATMDVAHKTGKYADYIPKLKGNLQSINDLFDTLLSITKWEYHAIKKSSVDIIPIIRDIQESLAVVYKDKKIVCTSKLPQTYIVSSHVDIFHIIFHNIIQNAYKYTPDKGTILISLDKNTLRIVDTGLGISPEDQKNIWQKFWKNHQKKGSSQGFGLGLYLVKLLVDKQGWDVSVASVLGIGTTFIVKFD